MHQYRTEIDRVLMPLPGCIAKKNNDFRAADASERRSFDTGNRVSQKTSECKSRRHHDLQHPTHLDGIQNSKIPERHVRVEISTSKTKYQKI